MTLHIIRGLPGAGKSTFAKSLGCFHVEADMFYVKNGEYVFDRNKTKNAHEWCQKQAMSSMSLGMDVAVSNTFTTIREMLPYIDHAMKTGHRIIVHKMEGKFGSVHNVPDEVMQTMASRWESYPGEETHD